MIGVRVRALGNDEGLDPYQWFSRLELEQRETRRAKNGTARTGEVVKCHVCGYEAKSLSRHITGTHGMTLAGYKEKFAVDRVSASDQGFKSGSDNPAHEHGGKFSKWSDNFIHGYDKGAHEAFKESHSEFMTNNPNNVFSRASCESDEEYSQSQKRDLEWFVEKFGEEEGRKRHSDKTLKWMTSFDSDKFSKISLELFDSIDIEGAYYASKHNDGFKEDAINKEYILHNEYGTFRLDFYVPRLKKCIEFDGDYWHSENVSNPSRERRRQESIEKAGIEVLRIKERDYKNNKEREIERCKKFLSQSIESLSMS